MIEPNQNRDALVSCRLRYATFAEKPKYETLPYTWGNESVKERILLDQSDFYAGRNLLLALKRFRQVKDEHAFWVDAIFIDQGNMPERVRIRIASFQLSIY